MFTLKYLVEFLIIVLFFNSYLTGPTEIKESSSIDGNSEIQKYSSEKEFQLSNEKRINIQHNYLPQENSEYFEEYAEKKFCNDRLYFDCGK
ncbi:hypothetical protein PVAND_014632 [Polypedilum vanderplanki]|uniref:Uncharacterized protein n=1 Tax=Polypedilum vanderplanki TaxID=319348 RepID=A0A9J6BAK7_POLVA|nr:hypothetical protein PVAND_014632 [Polypedilum vanderplanki]